MEDAPQTTDKIQPGNVSTDDVHNTSSDSGVASVTSSPSLPDFKLLYKFRMFVKDKHLKQFWSVEFNHLVKPSGPKIFAAVGGPKVSIFEITPESKIKFLHCFVDEDPKEDFYTCCWTVNETTKDSVLLTGGARGVIRIFEPNNANTEFMHLIGHGQSINSLKISPRKPFLLASASKDRSIRLWNIVNGICIISIHGIEAHRDEVISIDFNRDCTKLASGGMDHMLAIWDLTTPEITSKIAESRNGNIKAQRAFKTLLVSYPSYSTRLLHTNYIDCIQWLNDFILSKSTENDFYCWEPGTKNKGLFKNGSYEILIRLNVDRCEFYYNRFATTSDLSIVGLGNEDGDVRLWLLDHPDHNALPFVDLNHPKRNANVRHISFSRCGENLIICCDDGTIWLYQR